jgi:hypothetical protein
MHSDRVDLIWLLECVALDREQETCSSSLGILGESFTDRCQPL